MWNSNCWPTRTVLPRNFRSTYVVYPRYFRGTLRVLPRYFQGYYIGTSVVPLMYTEGTLRVRSGNAWVVLLSCSSTLSTFLTRTVDMGLSTSAIVCFVGIASHSRRVLWCFVRRSREISPVPSLYRAYTDTLIHRNHC